MGIGLSHRVLESIGLSHIGKSGHCGDSVESSGHIEGAPLQLITRGSLQGLFFGR